MRIETLGKSHIGFVREVTRLTASGQRYALEGKGVASIIDLASTTRYDAISAIRRRDTIYVQRLHILAARVKRKDWSTQRDLFCWVKDITSREAVIVETDTGLRSDDLQQLLCMLDKAVSVLTRSARGSAIKTARENGGSSLGRPRKNVESTREVARAIWFDPDLTGNALKRALRRVGWSRTRCYRAPPDGFGPREGGE